MAHEEDEKRPNLLKQLFANFFRGVITEVPKTGVVDVDFYPAQPNAQVFRQDHPDYQKIMISCLRNLYSGD